MYVFKKGLQGAWGGAQRPMHDLQAKLREGRATIQQQKIQRCSTILAHLYTPGWQGRLKKNDTYESRCIDNRWSTPSLVC